MKEDFLSAAQKDIRQLEIIEGIQKRLASKAGDYTLLGIECHLCHEKGHISLDCKDYQEIKGNLGQQWLKKIQDTEWNNGEDNNNGEAQPAPQMNELKE